MTSALFSVLLAVAVNVATGGTLPDPFAGVSWLAWPTVGLLGVVGVALAVWQQRLTAVPPQGTAPEVAQLTGTAPEPHPAAAGLAAPAELPAARPLFGREREVAEIGRLLQQEAPVILLAAAPGSGKTSLALRVAQDVRSRFPGGQLFAALLGASAEPVAAEAVLARFLGALGVPEDERRGGTAALAARFRSAVADRAVLVVLDDARDAAQVMPLLPGGTRCATIVTSRRQLASVPGGRPVAIGALDDDAALALLAETAGDERIDSDPEGAKALVAVGGGLPLAVRIIGGRLRARAQWTPSALAERLKDDRRRLDELRQGDLAVRVTFQAAYAELSEVDRMVFRRAGSHPGQVFGLGAASARAGLDRGVVAESLERLVDAFLVESPSPERYHLHDLLRLFAEENLDPAETRETLRRLLLWLTEAGELEDIPAVLHEGAQCPREVLALVDAKAGRLADPFDRLAAWQAAAEAARTTGEDMRRARALRWVSHSWTFVGEVQRALPAAEEGLALAEAAGDTWEIAQTGRRYGEALRDLHRFAESETALLRVLDLFVTLGEVDEEVEVRTALGTLYNVLREPELSLPMLERAHELIRESGRNGDSGERGWVLLGLGLGHKFAGHRADAEVFIEEAFGLATRIGDDYLLGYCYQERGWLADDDGRFDDAEHEFDEMLRIFRGLRIGSGAASALVALGVVGGRLGAHERALDRLGEGISAYRRLGDAYREGEARVQRARILDRLGRRVEAVEDRAQADTLGYQRTGVAGVHRGDRRSA
ncbi:NB-ARC domain-containing protein [Dactylosporangium sp. NPDC048998]|uniref:NB-ARC domain-containing protein n=1 Tax=Dactylosporangium sp. NPDC048998 TaxID=3363976 RepID=UPI00371ECC21